MHNRGNQGYSIYGQKMTGNIDKNRPNINNNFIPRPNPYQNQNNPHQPLNAQNQSSYYMQNYNPSNIIKRNSLNYDNKKYSDLNIKTYFSIDGKPSLSSEDIELNKELEAITNQYLTIFDNINILSRSDINNKNQSKDDMIKIMNIKKDLDQVRTHDGNEYSNFIGQLYEVSKKDEVLNLGYDMYKKDKKNGDEKIKEIIDEFKYEIVLFTNKDNTTREIYDKLNDYIYKKKEGKKPVDNYKKSNSNGNNEPAPIKNNNNDFNLFNDINEDNDNNENNNKGYPHFNIDLFKNNNNNDANNGNNNNNYNDNDYTIEKNQFEDPNLIDDIMYKKKDYDIVKKLNVKFLIDGNETCHVFQDNESGECLLLYAMQEADDPKLFTQEGQELTFENLSKLKIKDIFENSEPIIIVQ